MRIKSLFTTLFASLIIAIGLLATPVSATANDFTFDSFIADYYLSKTDSGSRLHVREELIAEFPNFDQNHGIERQIPYTNQAGKNLTVQNQAALNLSVTRNGATEPFTISQGDNYFNVRIGSPTTYVQGRQTYVLEYDFTNVITDFGTHQELYWDTNGTGWLQPFTNVTARLHLDDGIAFMNYPGTTSPTSCYVGSFNSNNQSRCLTTQTTDGFTFTTTRLSPRENLTFDLTFPASTFNIPAKPRSYIFPIIAAIEIAVIALISFLLYKKSYLPVHEKHHWYKTAPIPPQYTPLPNYTVAQLSRLSLKQTKDSRIATMLELVVQRKLTLIKGEKHKFSSKYHWSFRVDSADLTAEQQSLLEFLNGGQKVVVGETYPLEKHAYSATLDRSYREYDEQAKAALVDSQDLNPTDTRSSNKSTVFLVIFCICVFVAAPIGLNYFIDNLSNLFSSDRYDLVASWLAPIILIAPIVALIIHLVLRTKFSKYRPYTQQGLEHANYLRGLKLYIEMAEADRLKFLQSVEGADTSAGGVVKLYEKLLPYAALFGLEQSWLNEMDRYYQMEDLHRPDWYNVNLAHALMRNDFGTSFSRPVDPSSVSSSGSSGGGGGGFSGGGGGGGGGGGW